MKKLFFLFFFSAFIGNVSFSQNFFVENKDFRSIGHAQNAGIQSFESYTIDHDALKTYMSKAAMQFSGEAGIMLQLPLLDKGVVDFMFYESPCMMPGISAKYPFIKSYKGFAVDNPSMNCRIDFGTQGMHGAVKTKDGSVYMDAVEGSDKSAVLFYYTKDQTVASNSISKCGFDPQDEEMLHQSLDDMDIQASTRSGENIPLRVYKLAIATTGEFGETLGQTVENTLSLLNTSVNRLNMIFENELSLKMVLVDDNDKLFHFDSSTDPFFDGSSSGATPDDPGPGLLSENPIFINNTIGFQNYDLGQIYTRGCVNGIGGVAFLGVLCGGVNLKAGGVTCFGGSNILATTVRVAAHEIGHQLSAQHSFNNCSGVTATENLNENPGTAYEPGSGISIMSYAGTCNNNGENNNLAGTSYDVYHTVSLNQMYTFTRLGPGSQCGIEMDIDNHEPDLNLDYENGFSIPIGTPFELTGIASDEDGDTLSYSWEQWNLGPKSILGSPVGNSPTFRNFYPDADASTRHFPKLSSTLSNASSIAEILPEYSRDLNFMFTVRDNNLNGGTASWEEVAFYATENAGPFKVLSQNTPNEFMVGERILVEWDVANTDKAPVNTKYVDIYLSIDGGYTMQSILAKNVVNDGAEYVNIPEVVSNQARIKIKAADNIYYDYNDVDCSIIEANEPGYYFNFENFAYDVCAPTQISVPIEGFSFGGYNETIEYSIIGGLPGDIPHIFTSNNISSTATTSLEIDFSDVVLNNYYIVTVQGVSSTNDTIVRNLELEITSVDYSEIASITPVNGSSNNPVTPYFEWTGSSNADLYTIQLSTSAKFEDALTNTINNIDAESAAYEDLLEKGTIYYWRILGENKCGIAEYGDIFAFSTVTETCNSYVSSDLPINISQSGMPTVESKIFITDQGKVSDVNVSIKGAHTYISQLRGTLVSPSGTEARMFGNNCFNLSNFDCGFDDESAFDISCPLTGGQLFIPQQALSVFKDEEIEGEWTFRIDDTDGGDGGKFEIFDLDLCSSKNIDNPYILNNNTLFLGDGARRNIGESLLRALHPTIESGDLIFTILRTPRIGTLLLNNEEVAIGDQFTQADIDANRLDYRHEGENIVEDQFFFTVVDGQGGWIETTAFNIEIESFTATENPDDVTDVFAVYPNPTAGKVILKSEKFSDSYTVQILGTQGKLLYNGKRSGSVSEIDLSAFQDGIYILKIENEDIRQVVKVIKN